MTLPLITKEGYVPYVALSLVTLFHVRRQTKVRRENYRSFHRREFFIYILRDKIGEIRRKFGFQEDKVASICAK